MASDDYMMASDVLYNLFQKLWEFPGRLEG
jgi:hypothetical protein